MLSCGAMEAPQDPEASSPSSSGDNDATASDAASASSPASTPAPGPPPPGHLKSIFELPNRAGEIEAVEGWVSHADFMAKYAPPFEAARTSANCSGTIKRLCGDLKECNKACQLKCIKSHYEELYEACFSVSWGEPVLFRGAARSMPAFEWLATDEKMLAKFPDAFLDGVEMNDKKETRVHAQDQVAVKEFIARYKTESMYAVASTPWEIAEQLHLPPFMKCDAGITSRLDTSNMWWSSGGTKSVIHNDGQDNVNCLFAGKKRIIFWAPTFGEVIEDKECGWVIAEEEMDDSTGSIETEQDGTRRSKGYGAFAGKMDVDAMDLAKYPCWGQMRWYEANMEAGDCLFIPSRWYHHVDSSDERNLAVNFWWWRKSRPSKRGGPADPDTECRDAEEVGGGTGAGAGESDDGKEKRPAGEGNSDGENKKSQKKGGTPPVRAIDCDFRIWDDDAGSAYDGSGEMRQGQGCDRTIGSARAKVAGQRSAQLLESARAAKKMMQRGL